MSRKRLLILAFVVPSLAISTIAQAGIGISDKRFWPDQARSSSVVSGGQSISGGAMQRPVNRHWYQGRPKSTGR
jgi:hypothetical protein